MTNFIGIQKECTESLTGFYLKQDDLVEALVLHTIKDNNFAIVLIWPMISSKLYSSLILEDN